MLRCRWDWHHSCGFCSSWCLRGCHRVCAHRNILFLGAVSLRAKARPFRCSPSCWEALSERQISKTSEWSVHRSYEKAIASTLCSDRESGRPRPLIELRLIDAMLVSVVLAVDLHIAQDFFGVGASHLQCRH